MNIFWQITLIEFLLNVAVFVSAIVIYGPIQIITSGLRGGGFAQKSATGLLFGIATVLALFLPIHLDGGAAVGCSTILLALAGPLDGPIAMLSALTFSIAIELLPLAAKGQPNGAAILSLFVSAGVGFVFQLALKYPRSSQNKRLQYIHLPLLGILSAGGGLGALAITQGTHDLASSIVPAMASNVLSAVILGTILLREKLRGETERALRESEASLAEQAKELALARDTAESASRAKSIFLANMSHELRTPLNAVLGYAQMLQRDRTLSKKQLEACGTIQQSGEHLLTLITDILDLSKIEAGKIEVQLGPVAITSFVQGIANIIRVKAEEKSLGFSYNIASDLPAFAQVDQKRLRQVLLNLLSNAVKFTDRGKIELRASLRSQPSGTVRIRFEVQDTGTGMTGEQLKKIFRPFEQVGDEQHRAGGTGLGLSISGTLVRLMGGEILVESTFGQGSCFSFDLPAILVDSGETVALAGRRVTGYSGSRKKLLVVDDMAANRSMLFHTLHGLGFEVGQAVNGLDALTSAQSSLPDLILMDIKMPTMDGLEAMRRIRAIANLKFVPIIAVSAGVTQDEQAASTEAGANVFLTKPIELPRLLHEMRRLLDLSWIYENPEENAAAMSGQDEQFIVPGPAQMESLRGLAKAGNMKAIREKADEFAALDARYRPFAQRISELALSYQSKAVLRFVEMRIEEQQVEKVAQP